jgi:hypothetical protein
MMIPTISDRIIIHIRPNGEADAISAVEIPAFSSTPSTCDASRVVEIGQKEELSVCLAGTPTSSVSTIEMKIFDIHVDKYFDPLALAIIASYLKSNGRCKVSIMSIRLVSHSNFVPVGVSLVTKAFLLSGLMLESEKREADGSISLEAIKKETVPVYADTRRLDFKPRVTAVSDLEEENVDIIDEDKLLEDEELGGLLSAPPDVTQNNNRGDSNDCGGRKACDNCTCGRAEKEKMGSENIASETQQFKIPTSSCGNCGKGDAFRCAGCPFLGKPAFKPGEEHLVLELSDDL